MRGLWRRSRRTTVRSLGGLGIHPEGLPVMSVEIVETPPVHEPMVLRLHGVLTAGRDGLLHELVDVRPARARERKEPLGVPARVANITLREALEEWLGQGHGESCIAKDHASGIRICELWVEREGEGGGESFRLLAIADRQGDRDLACPRLCHD